MSTQDIDVHNQNVINYYVDSRNTMLEESKNWKPVNKLMKYTSMTVRDYHKPGSVVFIKVVTTIEGVTKERIPVNVPADAFVGQIIDFQVEWKIRPFVQYFVDIMIKGYQEAINKDVEKNGFAYKIDYYIEGFCGVFDGVVDLEDEEDLLNHTEINFICFYVKMLIQDWIVDKKIPTKDC